MYLTLRAIHVPLLHDEIATFFRFVYLGKFIPYHCEWSTNNHFLNSLLTYISYHLLGSSSIAQRFPNLLFIPVFFFFIYKISQELKSQKLGLVFIILMLSFHNFIDFFSFSRGYGIALSLIAGSTWFTLLALKTNKTKHVVIALVCMLISTSAILIMVNSYIILIAILFLHNLYVNRQKARILVSRIILLFFLGLIPVILVAKYLFDMEEVGRLDYGGMEGFWEVSVKNLTSLLVGTWSNWLNILVILFLVLMTVSFINLLFNRREESILKKILNPKLLFFYFLMGNFIGFFLEHHLFGILYPEERTSIQFVFFFFGSMVFLTDQLNNKFKRFQILPFLPFVLLPVHFVYSMNLDYSKIDSFNFNIPERFYDTVQTRQVQGDFPPTVQGYQLRVQKWNWYNFTKKGEQSLIHYNSYPALDGDFQIVMPQEFNLWEQYYHQIDTEEKTGAVLLERKNKLQRTVIYFDNTLNLEGSAREYHRIAEGTIDSLVGSSLYFGFKFRLVSPEKPFHARLVVEIRDENDQVVRYEYIPFDWFRREWLKDGKPFINGTLIHDLPSGSKKYYVYLWNIYKKPFTVRESEFSIFKLDRDY